MDLAIIALSSGAMVGLEQIFTFDTPAPKLVTVQVGSGSSFDDTQDAALLGPVPSFTFYDFRGALIDHTQKAPGDHGQAGLGQALFTAKHGEGRSALRQIETPIHPEYVKMTVASEGKDDVCISYILIVDSVDTPAVNLLSAWNGSIGQQCGMPWYASETFLPSASQDFKPPCVWFSANGNGTLPQGMSFRLRDMSDLDRDKAVGLADQYASFNDTLCAAPARLQFWRETTRESCIPRYTQFPAKAANGSDANHFEAMHGHVLDNDCNPGVPWSNPDNLFKPPPIPGRGSFGGTSGFIPASDVPGQGAFGGTTGFIPIDTPPSSDDDSNGDGSACTSDDPTEDCGDVGDDGDGDGDMFSDGDEGTDMTPTATTTLSTRSMGHMKTIPGTPTPTPDDTDTDALRLARRHRTPQERNPSDNDKCHDQLTISEHAHHAGMARQLCESETSLGPDFVTTAGRQFCDMCTRRLWPLCSADSVDNAGDGCFHLETKALRLRAPAGSRRRDEVQRKKYRRVDQWRRK